MLIPSAILSVSLPVTQVASRIRIGSTNVTSWAATVIDPMDTSIRVNEMALRTTVRRGQDDNSHLIKCRTRAGDPPEPLSAH
jgi:hypothetical protein